MTKSVAQKGRGFFFSIRRFQYIIWETKTDNENGNYGGTMLTGCFHCFGNLLPLPFFFSALNHLPREDTVNSGLGSPTLTLNEKNALAACQQTSLMGAILQRRFVLS